MAFFWEGNTGGITTPQQAARKRAISEAMLGQSRSGASNWGEGLARVAQALTGTVLEGRASDAERAGADEVAALLAGLSPESGFGDISAALANPWLAESPGGSAIAQALLGENMRRSDPMYGLNLDAARMSNERAAMELDSLRNPVADPWAGTQVINDQVVGMGEGGPQVLGDFRSADVTPLMQNLEAAGLIPGTPEYAQAIIDSVTRPQSQITIGGQQDPLWGDAPKDQVWLRDANGEVITEPDPSERGVRPVSVPISGSQLDIDAAAAADQAAARQEQAARYSDIVVEDIDRALDLTGWNTTGLLGQLLNGLPGSSANSLGELTKTIRANIGFDRLQAMREASPTGGALGSVSNFENELLQSTLGNLAQSQNEEQLRFNLERLKNVYLDIIHGPGNRPADQSQANPDIFGGAQPTEIAPGITIRRLD